MRASPRDNSMSGLRPQSAPSAMNVDVCVIGGGPAGAVTARRLAALGHRVCLLERAAHPNHKVGAALPPGIIPLLYAVGLRGRVEGASFVRPTRVVNLWASEVARVEATRGEPGFVVDRARFDQILLDAAEEAGVAVLRPARAVRMTADADGLWYIETSGESVRTRVRAAFAVDATGKGSAVAGKRKRCSHPTVALNAYWRGVKVDASAVLIESGPDEWFWGATLPDGTFNAMVFLDPHRCRPAAGHDLESLYRLLLAGTSLFRRCLDAKLSGRVSACDASSYADANVVGARLIKVGDASFSIDPLSSQGVQAAVTSGLQAAVVVNTIMRSEADAAAAVQFYRDRQREAIARHAQFAARFYAGAHLRHDGQFWRKRAATVSATPQAQARAAAPPAGLRLRLSDQAALVATPCVTGDFIRNVPSLVHPGLERPVAYLRGTKISELIDSLKEASTTTEIVRAWAPFVPSLVGFEYVNWLYRAGVLVNATGE